MNDPAPKDIAWSVTALKVWAEIYVSDLQNTELAGGSTALIQSLQNGGYVGSETSPTNEDAAQDVVTLDAASATFDFGLNEIPQCALALAIGREVGTLNVSVAHLLTDALKQLVPIRVFVQGKITSGVEYDDWPDGPFLAFDGLTVSSAFRTSFGTAEYLLSITHWLTQLGFSTMLSRLFAPGTPMQLSYDGGLINFTDGEGGAIRAGSLQSDGILTAVQLVMTLSGTMGKDLWGDPKLGIRQIFTQLANRPVCQVLDLVNLNTAVKCQLAQGANTSALAALGRFEPLPGSGGIYRYGTLLKLRKEFDKTRASLEAALYIGAGLSDVGSTTFWDKLVTDYSPSFLFAVVPMVERALVVPFGPGSRQSAALGDNAFSWQEISASEITDFEMASGMPRPIRGVTLMAGRALMSGHVGGGKNPSQGSAIYTAGAIFDTCRDGVFLYKTAPPWLANVIPAHNNANQLVRPGQYPTNSNPSTAGIPVSPTVLTAEDKSLWQAYAQSLYVQELLRFRQGRVSGRPRWDIAPGSAVAVELPRDRFVELALNPGDPEPQYINGTVLRVTTVLSAHAPSASTTLQLGFLRTSVEDQDDNYSYEGHPVWDTSSAWFGAPLVDFAAQ